MNVYDLLHKELKRLDIKEESIKDEIKDLPLGTLVRIKRNDNVYVYLKHRENRKVISVFSSSVFLSSLSRTILFLKSASIFTTF